MTEVGQELLNVPFPEMVVKLASAIAEGQYKMDLVSCEIAKLMGDSDRAPVYIPDLSKDNNETIKTSMIGAGFQPTFYQFTDTIIEVKMAITMTSSSETSVTSNAGLHFCCFSASVNATYSSKFSYSVEGSSLLRTKITPVPTNTFMQKLLDMRSQQMQQQFQLKIKEAELKMEENNKKNNPDSKKAE